MIQHASNQGHVTPKLIVQCGPVSNLLSILYLYYLSASWIKITQAMLQTKLNVFFFLALKGK